MKCGGRSRAFTVLLSGIFGCCWAATLSVLGSRRFRPPFGSCNPRLLSVFPLLGACCRMVGDSLSTLGWISESSLCGKLFLDRARRLLRVSWRHCRWLGFLQRRRRDSVLLAGVPFDHERYKTTAKAFAAGNGDVRAVLTGAACSAAAFFLH